MGRAPKVSAMPTREVQMGLASCSALRRPFQASGPPSATSSHALRPLSRLVLDSASQPSLRLFFFLKAAVPFRFPSFSHNVCDTFIPSIATAENLRLWRERLSSRKTGQPLPGSSCFVHSLLMTQPTGCLLFSRAAFRAIFYSIACRMNRAETGDIVFSGSFE